MTDHDPTDVDRILGALRGPDPPEAPPVLPAESTWWSYRGWALAAALMLTVVAGGVLSGPEGPTARGVGAGAPEVDLRVVVDDGGRATRIRRGRAYPLGQQVFFGVGAEPEAEVSLWVDGPTGRQVVTRVQAGPEVQTLPMSFLLDAAGTWSFYLAAAPVGVCPPGSCDSVEVRVE